MTKKLFGAIEAGGTKFVCAIGSGPDDLQEMVSFPTTRPQETMEKTIHYLQSVQKNHGSLQAIGIASFGPLDHTPWFTNLWLYYGNPETGMVQF